MLLLRYGGYANEMYLYDVSGFNTNGTTGSTLTINATGSFETNAITIWLSIFSFINGSNQQNMVVQVIMQALSGNGGALNTDIVLKLSADGGSNYCNKLHLQLWRLLWLVVLKWQKWK